MIAPLFIAVAFVAAIAFAVYLIVHLRREVAAHATTSATLQRPRERFKGVQDADAERQRVLAQLEVERAGLRRELDQAERDAAHLLDLAPQFPSIEPPPPPE